MYRQILGSLLLVFALSGCRKNNDLSFTETQDKSHIQFSLDDSPSTEEVTDPDHNKCSDYLFGGSAGYYFGCTTGFQVSNKSAVNITFGTGHAKSAVISKYEFEKLIATGPRKFGSLGAFNSWPALNQGCVEISFTDNQDRRWSSTSIEEKQTSFGIDAVVSVTQPSSGFVIDNIKVQDPVNLRYLIEGHFQCLLYEVNGTATRRIKGQFRGIVDAIR
jgi:hypothetical protein